MDEPKPLNSLFKEKIFRIPDYQRGYAWQRPQLKAFWEDLINLSDGNRCHYTGVLTLKAIGRPEIEEHSKEHWLVEDHSYQVYHIIDGQQRLTTFIIFLQALVEVLQSLPENREKANDAIYLTDSLNLHSLQEKFLFKIKPTGNRFRTYKFGYTEDNPSYEYLRYRILGEDGAGSIQETFYTLNLSNAKKYFTEQLQKMFVQAGHDGLVETYKKLTQRFLFNEYVIKDEFDVFVAFETMNNRGKSLSNLELLKNRLIYLTTLYTEAELDVAARHNLRNSINEAWKEVYMQLGRNKSHPLNDDDFLRAHWTLYYTYSRKTGKDYIRFLLDEEFTPQQVHEKVEIEVALASQEEKRADFEDLEVESDEEDVQEASYIRQEAELEPARIADYVLSLKACSCHWFKSFFPHLTGEVDVEECRWLEALNRIGMGYFRPLVMSILKKEPDARIRIRAYQKIERFIFLNFRINSARGTHGSSKFFVAARELDRGNTRLPDIEKELDAILAYAFHSDGSFRCNDFSNQLFKKFRQGTGYYGWASLRYFLFEYELGLLASSRQKKVDWEDLLKTKRDFISIEHIYPQSHSPAWDVPFAGIAESNRRNYNASLGNLLLLSTSINSALQNDGFEAKKLPRFDDKGEKIRNGYADGSHSEIEVSAYDTWGPDQIRNRGLRLLGFLEDRWNIRFRDGEKERLLFLDPIEPSPATPKP